MTKEIYYKTDFKLEWPVNDLEAAQEYLLEDDMTKYLIDSLRDDNVNEKEISKIKDIKWKLQNVQSGYILLTTTDILPNNILNMISEWVSGQNSDGLGEGFEQQDFAECIEEDGYYDDEDEYYEEDSYHMASFDWKTNKYQFRRVTSPYSLRENYHVMRVDEMNNRGKYSWRIFSANSNGETEKELYTSFTDGQEQFFDNPEDALRDAVKFINFYNDEFKRDIFSIEVFDEINPDFVMGEELHHGKLTNFNNLNLAFNC